MTQRRNLMTPVTHMRDARSLISGLTTTGPDDAGTSVDDDRSLVARARKGDERAFDQLVQRHKGVAYRAARSLGGVEDVDDIVQDAFIKVHRRLDRYDPDRPFRPWLMAFVANEASHRRRSRARRQNLAERFSSSPATSESTPEDEALVAADRRKLWQALQDLSEKDRRVIVYRHLLEMSEIETAAAIGCPVGTVKSRLARALKRLRVILSEASDHHG